MASLPKRRAAPPCLPAAVEREARLRCLERVGLAAPHLEAYADGLLARLAPPRWALEWSLPYWLGGSLGLPDEVTLRLVVSNLLGLGFVRLQDDLIDRELPPQGESPQPDGRASALLLSATLQHLWSGSLRELCGADPRFWEHFDAYLAQWQAATWASLAAPPSELGPAELTLLAYRGAPLKVCVAAACLLADRPDRLARLAEAVNDLLTAAVLLDQALDWVDDLSAGRPNAFAIYVTSGRQEGAAPSRRAISSALAASAGADPYFRMIGGYLALAAEKAEEAGPAELASYARWLAAQAAAEQSDLRRQVRAMVQAAGAWLGSAHSPESRE